MIFCLWPVAIKRQQWSMQGDDQELQTLVVAAATIGSFTRFWARSLFALHHNVLGSEVVHRQDDGHHAALRSRTHRQLGAAWLRWRCIWPGGRESNRAESVRGRIAAWLLIGFGLVYLIWGFVTSIVASPSTRPFAHGDESRGHAHPHSHFGDHAHVHDVESLKSLTPWIFLRSSSSGRVSR